MVEQYTIKRRERLAHSFRAFSSEAPSLQYKALAQIEAEIARLAQLRRYEAAWKVCCEFENVRISLKTPIKLFDNPHKISEREFRFV